MSAWSRQFYTFAVSCVLLGCASDGGDNGGSGSQATDMRMAATDCMSQATAQRQVCEQKCPQATGSEHFSMQHRLAMEYAACTERCSGTMEEAAMSCKATQ